MTKQRSFFVLAVLFLFCISSGLAQRADGNHKYVLNEVIESKILQEERTLHIFLPYRYYQTEDSYPLQVVLGSPTRVRMFQGLSNYLGRDYHVRNGQLYTIPPSIIVGVGKSITDQDRFSLFIREELIPFIEKKFRKCHDKLLVGHSRDGGFVLKSLFDPNSPFNAYFASAPDKSKDYLELMRQIGFEDKSFTTQRRLVLSCSRGDEEIPYEENRALIQRMSRIQHPNFSMASIQRSKDSHHSILPASTTDALRFIYKDWPFVISKTQGKKATELFMRHYVELSEIVGQEILPAENDFYMLVYWISLQENDSEKIKLLKKCKEIYPNAQMADAYLARSYYKIGKVQEAIHYNEIALGLDTDNPFANKTKELIEENK